MLRSDRLLGLPPADRQSCSCSPAIEGIITQYPPNTRGFPRHVNGKGRSPSWQPNVGIRGKPGGSWAAKPGKRAVTDIVALGRAVCTHRMGLGGSRQRLGNDGCRQRVYDARYRSRRTRKRRSTYISAGPCGRPTAEAAERRLGPLSHCRGGWDRPGFF